MDVAAVFKAVLTPDKDRSAENFTKLSVGDRLTGRVLQLEPDGRALIDLGRFRALAHTTLPVQVGQKLPLTVIRTGDPTQLRLDPDAMPQTRPAMPQMSLASLFSDDEQSQALKSLDTLVNALTAAGEKMEGMMSGRATGAAEQAFIDTPGALQGGSFRPEQARQALDQLKTWLKPMSMEASVDQQGRWVQSAVEDSGVLFEVKLAQAVGKGMGINQAEQQASMQRAVTDLGGPPNAGGSPIGGTSGLSLNGKPVAEGTHSQAAGPIEQNSAGQMRPQTVIEGGQQQPSVLLQGDTGTAVGLSGSRLVDPNPAGGKTLDMSTAALTGLPSVESELGQGDEMVAQTQSEAARSAEAVRHIAGKDLKPQLIILKNFLSSLNEPAMAELNLKARDVTVMRETTGRLLSHVEQQQERAVRTAGEPDLYQVFTHLLPIKDQASPLRLKVYYPKKGRPAESDPRYRIALLLDMDEIGPVRADLALEGRHLRINFFVSNESVRDMFEQNLQDLDERLAGEFEQVLIGAQVSRERIAQFEGEDLLGPPLGKIDIKA